MTHLPEEGRRDFIKKSTLGLSALTLGALPLSAHATAALEPENKKLGVAIVGLSWFSRGHIAKAFGDSQHCRLAGVVSGNRDKARDFQQEHGIPDQNVYTYDTFDEIADNPDIDIVHIVLPNALHAEYTMRAAAAGKHVICEKPMETTVEKGQAMVDACKKAGVLLQVGYRCPYDPYHQELQRLTKEKAFGEVKLIQMAFSFFGVHGGNWRFTNKDLAGGGAIMDLGVYCVQSARFIMDMEPVAVTARTYKTFKDKLPDMEETIMWEMEFANGAVATCLSSYAASNDFIHVSAERGNYGLKPAFGLTDVEGYVNNQAMSFPRKKQHALQMDAFAKNILDGTPVVASGESGLQDLKLIEAIYKAAQTGERIEL